MKKIFLKLLVIFAVFLGLIGCELVDNPIGNVDDKNPIVDNEDNDDNLDEEDDHQDEDDHDEEEDNQKIDINGYFTSKDEVALYIYTYKKLPSNYMTKDELKGKSIKYYWTEENKKSVGGDIFYNREGLLPKKEGRIYYECDINYRGGTNRGRERIVFSNDGLIFYTNDHYESFVMYNPEDGTWRSY